MKITGPSKQSVTECEGDILRKCIWMLAGAVGYKLCARSYDCEQCSFDRAMRESARTFSQQAPQWDQKTSETARRSGISHTHSTEWLQIDGIAVAATLFFHPAHLWVRVEEEGRARVGMDDFGGRLIGRIYSVELPPIGSQVVCSEGCWRIAHAAGETLLLSPVTGIVRDHNRKLLQQPSLINHQPFEQGWVMVVAPDSLADSLKYLHYGQKGIAWYREEIARLDRALAKASDRAHRPLGQTLQDGGARIEDLSRAVGPEKLRELINQFLSVETGRT